MNQFIHYWSMGKYSAYVWSSYGLAVAVFLGHCVALKRQQRIVHQQLQHWFKR